MAFYYVSAPYQRMFTLVQSANHVLALTGASPTIIISKAGASFIYSDVAAVEVATGWYRIPMTTTTTNTVGDLAFHVTATSADDRDWVDQVLAGVQVATIVQAVKDDLTNQIWATATRTVTGGTITTVTTTTSVASPVGVGSNFDKTGYTLTQAAYDQLVNQAWATPTRTVTGGTITTVTTVTSVSAAGATAIADSVLDRDMAAGVDSGSDTVRTVRQALRFLRNKWSMDDTTAILTVTKENDSTASWTTQLATSAAAAPVVGSDPAGP